MHHHGAACLGKLNTVFLGQACACICPLPQANIEYSPFLMPTTAFQRSQTKKKTFVIAPRHH
jgi:hypothetical protein